MMVKPAASSLEALWWRVRLESPWPMVRMSPAVWMRDVPLRSVTGAASDDALRGRVGLHPPGPARDHALRRRGAAGQAGDGVEQARHRPHALHPG